MTRAEFIASARRVIQCETRALQLLDESLDEALANAIDLLLTATGRIIVSGMGKSGHIARKIASTLASTGTPAHFVHPAEASHGDLGMMAKGDVALVLSNSGETPELSDLISYTRRFGIPMIGVASNPASTLLQQ
ncbi:MAG: SIS domain-containing protein, partial [Pseudomonadota bacterium]